MLIFKVYVYQNSIIEDTYLFYVFMYTLKSSEMFEELKIKKSINTRWRYQSKFGKGGEQ